MTSRFALSLVLAVGTSLGAGCGGAVADADGGAGADAGTDAQGAVDAPGPIDSGALEAGALDAGSSEAGSADAGACRTALDPLPVAMYVMIDQSGAMGDPLPGGGGTRWDALEQGLGSHVAGASASTQVGVQYYGLPSATSCPTSCILDADCGTCGPCIIITPGFGMCSGAASDSCVAADYATPDVEIGPAPSVTNAITASLSVHGPSGTRTTSAALQGAVDHAGAFAAAHLGTDVLAVLVTGGDPVACDPSLAAIDAIAAGGTTDGVRTAVVSMGATRSFADGVAAAGGTGVALSLDLSTDASARVHEAFAAISMAGCAYRPLRGWIRRR